MAEVKPAPAKGVEVQSLPNGGRGAYVDAANTHLSFSIIPDLETNSDTLRKQVGNAVSEIALDSDPDGTPRTIYLNTYTKVDKKISDYHEVPIDLPKPVYDAVHGAMKRALDNKMLNPADLAKLDTLRQMMVTDIASGTDFGPSQVQAIERLAKQIAPVKEARR